MTLRAQVIIPMDSNVPADAAVNVLHFQVNDPAEANLSGPMTAINNLYLAFGPYYSVRVNGGACHVKWYDLTQPKPRPPIADLPFGTVIGTSTTELPAECAIVLSFQGARVAGVDQRRRRGRIYVGPLGLVAAVAGMVASAARTAFANAAEAMWTASMAAAEWTWVVQSQYPLPNGSSTQVTDGWIDDAFDTQRRRGLEATTRLLWP